MIRHAPLWVGAVAVFGTRTIGLVLAASTTFVLARLLGPSDLGAYYLLVLVPSSTLALASFGLPAAITFMTGRGADLDQIRTSSLVLAIGLSGLVVLLIMAFRPFLAATVLAAAPIGLLPVAAATVPGVFLIAFANSIILGRQRLRRYNGVLLGQSIALFVGQILVVGLVHGGLLGALWTYVGVTTATAAACVISAARLAPFRWRWHGGQVRGLVSYGVRLQPASLAGFFSYRADVFLISTFLRNSSALGVYSLAVSIAELCFYIPDAVSTVLFPRVAASDRPRAAELVPIVCRITLLLTAVAALGLAFGALVIFPIALPAFARSIAPALILLPGIVGLSASKVLSGYLSGIGRPGPVSLIASSSLIINLVANLILIPTVGINGAAAASLLSYSLNGAAMISISSRQAGASVRDMVLARWTDIGLVRQSIRGPRSGRV